MDDSKIEKILLPVPAEKMKKREEKVKSQFWPKVKSFAGQIPFSEDLVAAYYCGTDTKTPLKVRGTLLAALAYFILPTDMVPDFLLTIGFSDDLAVLTAAMTLVQSHVTDEHRQKALETLDKLPEHPAQETKS